MCLSALSVHSGFSGSSPLRKEKPPKVLPSFGGFSDLGGSGPPLPMWFSRSESAGGGRRTLKLAPIAEIFQPIVHIASRPSSQQLEQAAHNNAYLQLVRDNNASVMPAR